jgi:hypothetical protein
VDHPAFGGAIFAGISFVRVWTLIAGQADADGTIGHARFRWFIARLEAAPLRWNLRDWTFGASALGEIGLVAAQGVAVPNAQSANAPWLALGAGLWASWHVSDAVALELRGSVVADLRRDVFQLGPPGGPPTDSFRGLAIVPQLSVGVAFGRFRDHGR